jgi:hypothetical protein
VGGVQTLSHLPPARKKSAKVGRQMLVALIARKTTCAQSCARNGYAKK